MKTHGIRHALRSFTERPYDPVVPTQQELEAAFCWEDRKSVV